MPDHVRIGKKTMQITTNLEFMLGKALGCSLHALDGKKARDIYITVWPAVADIHDPDRRAEFMALEAQNGVGKLPQGQKFLIDLMTEISEQPDEEVEVWHTEPTKHTTPSSGGGPVQPSVVDKSDPRYWDGW